MEKKIRSMMLLIVMSMIFTSCGSADTDAGNKKDDLSDVVVIEDKDPYRNFLPIPYEDIENLIGRYTNIEKYDLKNDTRYFTALTIANDRADDGNGNWLEYPAIPGEILKNWKPDDKLLDDGFDDIIQYCKKNNIPYLLLEKQEKPEDLDESEVRYIGSVVRIQLCISPDEFFQYKLFPQLTYVIRIVDGPSVDEQWENFVNNHN